MGTLSVENRNALMLEEAEDFFKASFAACMCPNTRLWRKDGIPWSTDSPEGPAFAVMSGPSGGLSTFIYHYAADDSQQMLNQRVISAHLIGELSFLAWVQRGCKDES